MPSDSRTTSSEVPTALLLPGLLCDQAVWAGQTAVLSPGVRCLIPDYGAIDTLPGMAQAALALAPPRFILVGHSMGGRVALEIMRTAAARVRALVLLDTGYQARPPGAAGAAEASARQSLVEIARSRGMRAMGQVWVRDMVPAARLADAALVESILAMVERRTPQVLAAQIRALLARPETADLLPGIRCPTLLVCGREDTWSPLARHEAMQRLIPASQLQVIEDCGHMAPMERPPEVASLLARWLAALPAAA